MDFRHLPGTFDSLPDTARFCANPDAIPTNGTDSCQHSANPAEPNAFQDQYVKSGKGINILKRRSHDGTVESQPAFPVGGRKGRFAALAAAKSRQNRFLS